MPRRQRTKSRLDLEISDELAKQILFFLALKHIIPLAIGIQFWKKLSLPNRIVLASILLSFLFDASTFFPKLKEINWSTIGHFYPLFEIILVGAAFLFFFRKKKRELFPTLVVILMGLVILIFKLSNTELHDPTTKGDFTAIELIVKICLSLIFFWYAIVNNDTKDFLKSSFFWFSTIYLIHSCSGIVVYTMMDYIQTDKNLLYWSMYFNWFLGLLTSLAFTYVFYAIGKKDWSTDLY